MAFDSDTRGKTSKSDLLGYVYDEPFQMLAADVSNYAADRIISIMLTVASIRSVLDIGCARGTWLACWQKHGADDVLGIDGPYINQRKLEVEPSKFVSKNLSESFRLGRCFDLVQSLEVAEHLPASRAPGFVHDLVVHAPMILFSAAQPGQGGENHLNERKLEYWRRLFLVHDYIPFDCLRPLIFREHRIPPWYRYNILLYVSRQQAEHLLPPFVQQFRVPPEAKLSDVSPLSYQMRKAIVRVFPRWLSNALARWNARH